MACKSMWKASGGRLSVDVGADHVNIFGRRPRGHAADALQQVKDRLRTLISDRLLQAEHLAE